MVSEIVAGVVEVTLCEAVFGVLVEENARGLIIGFVEDSKC